MLLVEFAELGPEVGVGVGVGSSAKLATGTTRNIKTKNIPSPVLKYFKCAMIKIILSSGELPKSLKMHLK